MDERYQLSLPGMLDRLDATGSLRIETDPLAAADLEIGGQTVEGVPPRTLSVSDLHDFDAIRALVDVVELRREKILRLGDVAEVELGPQFFDIYSDIDGYPAASIILKQAPGSNAAEVIEAIKEELEAIKAESFPPGMDY